MSSGAVTLGDLAARRFRFLEVECTACGRRGRLSVARLIAEHGASTGLPALRSVIAGDCPRIGAVGIYDRCQVRYPQLASPQR